jgi:hypothetical protein
MYTFLICQLYLNKAGRVNVSISLEVNEAIGLKQIGPDGLGCPGRATLYWGTRQPLTWSGLKQTEGPPDRRVER